MAIKRLLFDKSTKRILNNLTKLHSHSLYKTLYFKASLIFFFEFNFSMITSPLLSYAKKTKNKNKKQTNKQTNKQKNASTPY